MVRQSHHKGKSKLCVIILALSMLFIVSGISWGCYVSPNPPPPYIPPPTIPPCADCNPADCQKCVDGQCKGCDPTGELCCSNGVSGECYTVGPQGCCGGFDLYEMGFNNITFAFFDCCLTGRLEYKDEGLEKLVEGREGFWPNSKHNDMSKALRMNSEGNHFFQGWYSKRPVGMLKYKDDPRAKNPFHYFCLYEWEKLREGRYLKEAIDYAMQETGKILDGEDARDSFRIRGQKYLWEVKIE